MSCPLKRSPSAAGRASVSGHAAASHSAVTETLTGSPPSPISLILKRILLKMGAFDRRKRRNYRGRVRRVKLGGIGAGRGYYSLFADYLLAAPAAAPPPNSSSERRSSSLNVSCKPANQSNSAPAPARARE